MIALSQVHCHRNSSVSHRQERPNRPRRAAAGGGQGAHRRHPRAIQKRNQGEKPILTASLPYSRTRPRLCEGAAQPGDAGDRHRSRSHVRGGGPLEAGLTQQEFARAAGASLGTVRKWEHGERSPSGAVRMLARILAHDPALVDRGGGAGGGDAEAEGWGGGVTGEIALSACSP
jgi:Helix-turn-helix domain